MNDVDTDQRRHTLNSRTMGYPAPKCGRATLTSRRVTPYRLAGLLLLAKWICQAPTNAGAWQIRAILPPLMRVDVMFDGAPHASMARDLSRVMVGGRTVVLDHDEPGRGQVRRPVAAPERAVDLPQDTVLEHDDPVAHRHRLGLGVSD